jgi:hypothetical protein
MALGAFQVSLNILIHDKRFYNGFLCTLFPYPSCEPCFMIPGFERGRSYETGGARPVSDNFEFRGKYSPYQSFVSD